MSLCIETLVLGQLQTNCYLAWSEQEGKGVIIDPADEGSFISQKILELGFKPEAILLTHGHFDHCLGSLELKLNFRLPILLNKADWPLFAQARFNTRHWLKKDPGPIPPPDGDLTDGQKIALGKETLEILATPGHTPGSICLIGGNIIFTGDTLFKDGVGRTDFSYSRPQELQDSLKKIKQYPGRLGYAGHGEPFII